jgi:hypothetical protein
MYIYIMCGNVVEYIYIYIYIHYVGEIQKLLLLRQVLNIVIPVL